MSFPDNWWTKDLEDEPCDGCGVKPSKHQGHGSFTCKSCYDGRWCPECTYALYSRDGSQHVCVSPEQRYIDQRKWEVEEILLDIGGNGESNWDRMLALIETRLNEERDAILQLLRSPDYNDFNKNVLIDNIENNQHRRTK